MLSGKYKRVGDLSFIGEIVAEGRSFIAPVGGVVEAWRWHNSFTAAQWSLYVPPV